MTEENKFKTLYPFFQGNPDLTNPINLYLIILSKFDEETEGCKNLLEKIVVSTEAGVRHHIEHDVVQGYVSRRSNPVKFSWEGDCYVSESIEGKKINVFYERISNLIDQGSISAVIVNVDELK